MKSLNNSAFVQEVVSHNNSSLRFKRMNGYLSELMVYSLQQNIQVIVNIKLCGDA